MNQEKQIKAILADLYAADESFRHYEKDLRKIILKILAGKPEVEFDQEFKEQLRLELLAKIEELKAKKPAKIFRMPNFSNIFAIPKLAYAFGGVIIALLVIVPVLYFSNKAGHFLGQPESKLASNVSMTKIADRAFGPLPTQGQLDEQGNFSEAGMGGGGVPPGVPSLTIEGQDVKGETMIIRPDYLNYRYVYKGDELVLDDEKVEVLRRQKGERARSGITNLLGSMDFGIFDLSTFKDAQVQRIEVVQDREFGYSIYVDLYEGTVSISRNYRKWLPGIMESYSMQATDIPDDAKLIETADRFIKEHEINMANYGQPIVNRYWESQSEPGGTFEEMVYIPQEVSITYPLVINGRKVYESGGSLYGLLVSVDVREMKVVGLYNLTSQNYETSMYEAETDAAKILETAERGGFYNWYSYYEGTTVEIELGTPELVYMRFFSYGEPASNELLVPALLFPITEGAEKVYRENVIVPLAKELLGHNDEIFPRPLIEPAEVPEVERPVND